MYTLINCLKKTLGKSSLSIGLKIKQNIKFLIYIFIRNLQFFNTVCIVISNQFHVTVIIKTKKTIKYNGE